MAVINNSISEVLRGELGLKNIEIDREVSRKRTVFYVNIDVESRYIFQISDTCVQDYSEERILKIIKEIVIPLLRKNPNKKVSMRHGLSVSVQE